MKQPSVFAKMLRQAQNITRESFDDFSHAIQQMFHHDLLTQDQYEELSDTAWNMLRHNDIEAFKNLDESF